MDMQAAIQAVAERQDLSGTEMTSVVRTIMTGEATDAQIGAFLLGLRMKGETVHEIAAAAKVMRELATSVQLDPTHLVDTAGTGGDGGVPTFNISTASAIVAAGAGARVAKHGNRSVSSKSGSADLLEAAGVKLDLSPAQITECVREAGLGFMFAPHHHQAMRYAIGPRRELGTRTLFNLLGPLTNPAGAPNQVVGVFSAAWVEPLAHVLKELGSNHVLVVHSEDGLDEISIGAPTRVAELRHAEVSTYHVEPDTFGLPRAPLAEIAVDSIEQSLEIVKRVLAGETGAARDTVLMNAAAAVYVADKAGSLTAALDAARESIDSGRAAECLDRLVAACRRFA